MKLNVFFTLDSENPNFYDFDNLYTRIFTDFIINNVEKFNFVVLLNKDQFFSFFDYLLSNFAESIPVNKLTCKSIRFLGFDVICNKDIDLYIDSVKLSESK